MGAGSTLCPNSDCPDFCDRVRRISGCGATQPQNALIAKDLAIPCSLVLKALRALATPLILLAVLHSFLTTSIPGRSGRRLVFLLLTNTLAAILIGLLVANILQPGGWEQIGSPAGGENAVTKQFDPWGLLQDSVPEAIIKPLVDNNVIQLIVIALSFGIVLRALKAEQVAHNKTDYLPIEQIVTTLFEAVIRILKWVIVLVPLAVFGIVAKTIALEGFSPFKTLGAFVLAVLLALFLQACFYLVRVSFGSWVGPRRFLSGGSDAFMTAFSTASSTATMPVTFRGLLDKVGLRSRPRRWERW